jgi:outer membrane lipoprotein-sorting protein
MARTLDIAASALCWTVLGTPTPALSAPVPPEATAAWEAMAPIEQLRARFEQVQHRKILSRPIISTGTLAFARPDKLSWRVEEPMASIFVLDGTKVGQAMPALDVRQELDLSTQPEWSRLVQGLVVWLSGDLERVEEDYDVSWQPGAAPVVVLVPRTQTLRALIAKMELSLAHDPVHVRKVRVEEPSGDSMTIELSEVELNPKLPEETFQLPAAK